MLKRKPRTCFFMSNVCNNNNLPCWMIYLLLWCYRLVSLFWLYCKQHFNITLYVLSLLQNSKWRQKKSCSSIFALVLKKRTEIVYIQLVYKVYTKICMVLFVIYNVFNPNMILSHSTHALKCCSIFKRCHHCEWNFDQRQTFIDKVIDRTHNQAVFFI